MGRDYIRTEWESYTWEICNKNVHFPYFLSPDEPTGRIRRRMSMFVYFAEKNEYIQVDMVVPNDVTATK